MITEEFNFLSYDKKTNIHGVKWIPDSGEKQNPWNSVGTVRRCEGGDPDFPWNDRVH